MINILLIDQERLFQKAFSKMISEKEDCHLIGVAENSTQALELLNRYHPQIVFADALLGRENGIAICRGIKERFPETVTYILSNYCNFEMIKSSMKAGVEEYLYKPLSRKKFSKILEMSNNLCSDDMENLQTEALFAAVEEKNYKKSYDIAKELVDYLFEECDRKERKEKLYSIESNLFYMIPGMDNIQKNYYIQKHEITTKILNKGLLCYCWLIQIITEVFRQLCTMKYSHMNQVFQYIEKNKNNEVSLSELAAEAGISSGYLSRIFKKYYSISVVDYIHLRKLLMAKYYMATSEMNISDISFLLGYSEAGYFCKIFKKYEGQTPSAFHRSKQRLTSEIVTGSRKGNVI